MLNRVVIIGDSTHNTLGAVRSFGEANIQQVLLLVCQEDVCHVKASKYLRRKNCISVKTLDECFPVLEKLQSSGDEQTLITTFDSAAEWVDANESLLSKWFRTPCRGRQIGKLFNKDVQCHLAKQCGLDVPISQIYCRSDDIDKMLINFPLITKPLISSKGTKGDIHICHNLNDFREALSINSHCEQFLIQEFIEKEYEINVTGVSLGDIIVLGGGIRKFRHWPKLMGTCTYGLFDKMESYDINTDGVDAFMKKTNYHGPFSVEFLHTKNDKNIFMEVNFRNDGLAYVSTCAGANLHALYMNPQNVINWERFKKTFMMNYSIDYLYVKDGSVSLWRWFKDLCKTRCFINFSFSDPYPVFIHYKEKLKSRFNWGT